MALFFTEGLATLFLWLSCRGSPQTTRQGAGSFRGALGDSNEVVPFTAAAAIMRLGKILALKIIGARSGQPLERAYECSRSVETVDWDVNEGGAGPIFFRMQLGGLARQACGCANAGSIRGSRPRRLSN